MSQLRRVTLLVPLLGLALVSDLPGLAGRLAASRTPRHHDSAYDSVWVGPEHRGPRVRITGTITAALSPGVSVPMDLGLTNPNPHALGLRRVTVSILGVTAPHATAAHPCTAADFRVRQMRRGVLLVPARAHVDLAGLGLPIQDWPQLTMTNRPVNQDGCKGASLRLYYHAPRARS